MINFLAENNGGNGSLFTMLIPLVLMFVVFYFMLIRPENKRKKEAEAMRNAIKTGDKVITIGGICGTVVSVKDDRFVLETSADQVRIEFVKWALSSNESAIAAQKEAAAKAEEEKAKAKAAKKAAKEK